MVRSAISIEPNQPLQIREYPTPSLESGSILAKVRLATICGSDLHTFLGRRGANAPSGAFQIIGKSSGFAQLKRMINHKDTKNTKLNWSFLGALGVLGG